MIYSNKILRLHQRVHKAEVECCKIRARRESIKMPFRRGAFGAIGRHLPVCAFRITNPFIPARRPPNDRFAPLCNMDEWKKHTIYLEESESSVCACDYTMVYKTKGIPEWRFIKRHFSESYFAGIK